MSSRAILVGACAVVVAVLGIALFSPQGLARLERLTDEEEAARAEVARRTSENERLARDIALLRGDTPAGRNTIEKRAREELGFVGAGEIVLSVPIDARAAESVK
jgi:cell division protein FtsB